jgi:DNA polymerase
LANANSGTQLLPWLIDRGYPFENLQKANVEKALVAEEEEVKNPSQTTTTICVASCLPAIPRPLRRSGAVVGDAVMTRDCRTVLRYRQGSAKTSTTKYQACMDGLAPDDRLRHCFQFAGGSRTNRWAGRKIQPQNLPRTREMLEPEDYIDFDGWTIATN